jgi:hypothetical protein
MRSLPWTGAYALTGPTVASRMYAGRADSENRIKELKEDLALNRQ